MNCDNTVHIPVFVMGSDGNFKIVILFRDEEMTQRPYWKLEETSMHELKFHYVKGDLSGITADNITKGIPSFLNICYKENHTKFYLHHSSACNNFNTITYCKNCHSIEPENIKRFSHNDYLFYLNEKPSNTIEQFGVFIQNRGVFVWKSPLKSRSEKSPVEYYFQNSIELQPVKTSKGEKSEFDSNCPPIHIIYKKKLHSFTFQKWCMKQHFQEVIYEKIKSSDLSDNMAPAERNMLELVDTANILLSFSLQSESLQSKSLQSKSLPEKPLVVESVQ